MNEELIVYIAILLFVTSASITTVYNCGCLPRIFSKLKSMNKKLYRIRPRKKFRKNDESVNDWPYACAMFLLDASFSSRNIFQVTSTRVFGARFLARNNISSACPNIENWRKPRLHRQLTFYTRLLATRVPIVREYSQQLELIFLKVKEKKDELEAVAISKTRGFRVSRSLRRALSKPTKFLKFIESSKYSRLNRTYLVIE